MKSLKKLRYASLGIKIQIVYLLILTVSYGARPELSLSTSTIYPRLYLLESEESLNWRGVINYNHVVTSALTINSLMEYGSENDGFTKPFRIHSLTAKLNHNHHELTLGRIPYWNSMLNLRIDGLKLGMATTRFGSFTLLGGRKAKTDFSKDNENESILLTAWSRGKFNSNYSVSYWLSKREDNTNQYLGSNYNTPIFSLRFSGTVVWDFNESRVSYLRSHLSKKVNRHIISLGYRQKRFNSTDIYPWSNKTITVAPSVSVGLRSQISVKVIIENQIIHRFQDEAIDYLHSTITYKPVYLSILGSVKGDNNLLGGVVGIYGNIGRPVTYSLSAAMNVLDYGDIVDLQQSTGYSAMISWQPQPKVAIRLFVRYYTNPYFTVDGRGGLSVNLAL